jgi:MarR family transcriptional regulator, organic hydroperoxide resistance regulator
VTRGTLTGVLKTLQGRGFVRGLSHPDDGRLVVVRLLPAGGWAIEDLFPRFNEQEVFASSGLSGEGRNQLAALSRIVVRMCVVEPRVWESGRIRQRLTSSGR